MTKQELCTAQKSYFKCQHHKGVELLEHLSAGWDHADHIILACHMHWKQSKMLLAHYCEKGLLEKKADFAPSGKPVAFYRTTPKGLALATAIKESFL